MRQRPVENKPFLPSSVFELNDAQSKQSLAQIYEEDYTAGTGTATTSTKDSKLAEEHAALTKMWDSICYKLDSLSNAHFTPKAPTASITTLPSAIASTTLESALPTTMSTADMLAPHEIYDFDIRKAKAKTELTPEEKRKIRTKVKQGRKRTTVMINSALVVKGMGDRRPTARAAAGAGAGGGGKDGVRRGGPKNVRDAKDMALESLVKTGKGVTVVGKEHVGLGKRKREETKSGGALKL